jgi:hypothetical protein
VNRIVRIVRGADQKLEIERVSSSMSDVLFSERIHVMDDQLVVNIVTIHAEIARLISKDCFLAKLAPFTRRVELLVDPTIESERLGGNISS